MNVKRRFILGLWLSLLLAACSGVAETYQLKPTESLGGDEHLIALEVNLMGNSTVYGDLNITASRVRINGLIEGDLTVAASHLEIDTQAVIQGDVVYCLVQDGTYTQASSALIWGEVRNNCQATARPLDLSPPWIVQIFSNLVLVFLAGFVAALGSIFLPQQVNRVQLTAYRQKGAAVGMGFLTLLILVGLSNLWRLSLVAFVPVLLFPLLGLAWLAVVALMILGGASIAAPFGTWILKLVRIRKTAPVITAMTGAMTLTFGVTFFRLINLGWLSLILASGFLMWGLGAALITRGGRR